MIDILSELSALLLSRIDVTHADDQVFDRAPELPLHTPTTRLILVVEGSLKYELGGKSLGLSEGDALLVPTWSIRQWSVAKGKKCRLAWCEFIVKPPPPRGLPAVLGRAQPCDPPTIGRITTALYQKRYLLAEGEAKALLARIFSTATSVISPAATQHRAASATVEQALAWMHLHYHTPMALDELAARANISPRQLRNQFLKFVGLTPRHYLTSLRMHHAQLLLRGGNQSVKQVALAVGYTDPLYFSRHYRAYWGYAPTQSDQRSTIDMRIR